MALTLSSRGISLLFLIVVTFYTIEGAPKGFRKDHSKKSHTGKKLQTKSYIDIDASDPFKVPKSSKYVDQPIPDFDEARTKVENEEGMPPSNKMDGMNLNNDISASLENINTDSSNDEGGKFKGETSKDDAESSNSQSQNTGDDQGAAAAAAASEVSEETSRQPDSTSSELESQQAPDVESNEENASKGGLERHNVPKRNEQFGKDFERGEDAPTEEETTGGKEKTNEE